MRQGRREFVKFGIRDTYVGQGNPCIHEGSVALEGGDGRVTLDIISGGLIGSRGSCNRSGGTTER